MRFSRPKIVYLALYLAVLLIGTTVDAIDVELREQDVTCDEDSAITVPTFHMHCQQSAQCTLGEEAVFEGQVSYSGVESSSVYMTAEITTMSAIYHYFTKLRVNLCGSAVTVPDGMECPEDGTYVFKTTRNLPKSSGAKSWLSTGYRGRAEIFVYSDYEGTTVIGHCTFRFDSTVTAVQGRAVNPPSAVITAATLACMAAALLLTALCCCMMRRRGKGKDDDKSVTSSGTSFTKMNDDTATATTFRSHDSGTTSNTSGSQENKKSSKKKKWFFKKSAVRDSSTEEIL